MKSDPTCIPLSRRSAMKAGVALAAPMIIPQSAFGANERLNIGAIGVGGRGAGDLAAVSSESIVALCDVDSQRLGAAAGRHPAAKQYSDYRKLLEQKDLDAVVVATPDHHHAPATIRALQRDLHVYCEKPLTHTVAEARKIATVAAERELATQMGTQNHEHPGYRQLVAMLQDNTIGDVTEVHIITDRPGRWWGQGQKRPTEHRAERFCYSNESLNKVDILEEPLTVQYKDERGANMRLHTTGR